MLSSRSTLLLVLVSASCAATESSPAVDLFDGVSLAGWKVTNFGGEGEVRVEEGKLLLDEGSPMTGVTWTGAALPTRNYEIELTATRVDGTDFFCCLTFPAGVSHCSLVVGGWGGTLVGLSCLDGLDASDNETSRTMNFADGRAYHIRVRVTDDRIAAWIDGAQVVDTSIAGRKISLRPEVLPSRPLAVASFETRAAFGRIRLRRL